MPRGESRARIADGPCLRRSAGQRGSGGGGESIPAALAARGSCSHLFSLFLAHAPKDVEGWDLVPRGQPLSQRGISSNCCVQG